MPPVGPGDHVRGEGAEVIVYLDLGCPHCAAAWATISTLDLRLCVRHFAIASKRPRSPALHAAAEAASRQREDAFWAFVDSIYADRGQIDDPHLWARARAQGLDLDRFELDRRSDEVAARLRRDFESGIRAGVTGTPTGFAAGALVEGDLSRRLGDLRAL
ncbi:MAG TPA: DsbA family protein [Solirubrobacterales bacterium]